MKNAMKLLIGSILVASALTACGKKSKSTASPGAAATGNGACQLNAQGLCTGAGTSGFVMVNTWSGNVTVTNLAKYSEFLGLNGLCYNLECTYVSGFFRLSVQTVSEELPNAVNFAITPRFGGGFSGRRLSTQGDGYANAAGNGFQVVYNRFNYQGSGYGYGYGYGGNRPTITPYGTPVTGTPAAPTQSSLQIVLTYADATGTIADAVVIYQGVQIAQGRLLARNIPVASAGYGYGSSYGAGYGSSTPGGNYIPYKSSSK